MDRIAVVVMVVVAALAGTVVTASAAAARTPDPTVWIDCEARHDGCVGLAGRFDSPDGSAVTSVAVSVTEVGTGTTVDVGGCVTRILGDRPATVQVECMIDAGQLGLSGLLEWTVRINDTIVWTSPLVAATCAEEPPPPPDDEPVEPPDDVTPPPDDEPVEPPDDVTPPPDDEPVEPPDDTTTPPDDELVPPEDDEPTVPIGGITPPPEDDEPVIPIGGIGPLPEDDVPVEPEPPSVVTPPAEAPEQVGNVNVVVAQEILPETGAELEWFAVAGLVMLALGSALLRAGRPRHTDTQLAG